MGGGLGIQFDRTRSRYLTYSGDTPQPDRLVDVTERDTGATLLGRTGFVVNLTQQLLLRADVEFGFRYSIPNVTSQIGLGWRF